MLQNNFFLEFQNDQSKIKFNPDDTFSQIGSTGNWTVLDNKTIMLVIDNQEEEYQFDNNGTIGTLTKPQDLYPKPKIILGNKRQLIPSKTELKFPETSLDKLIELTDPTYSVQNTARGQTPGLGLQDEGNIPIKTKDVNIQRKQTMNVNQDVYKNAVKNRDILKEIQKL